MTITDLFAKLGAPLQNQRWSWGATSDGDRAVVLRVWAGETRSLDGARFVRLTNHSLFSGTAHRTGHDERLRHVELIRSGVPAYCILCEPKDPRAHPKELKSFDAKSLFVGGQLLEIDGDSWLELKRRVPVSEVRAITQQDSGPSSD